jgi:putative Holliday junction resolvase
MENDRGPILAVDPGTVRVGLAISDDDRSIAFPLEVVPAKNVIERIRVLIAERGIAEIVVGIPLTLGGEAGPEADRVANFARRLERRVAPVPVRLLDERLSSAEADRYLERPGNREHRDAVAASVILERYLGSIR